MVWNTVLKKTYFNPRSHEGSDLTMFNTNVEITDFNPRSHEGSDHMQSKFLYAVCDFNPRSHEGSDRERLLDVLKVLVISIHAPTKGATASSSGIGSPS